MLRLVPLQHQQVAGYAAADGHTGADDHRADDSAIGIGRADDHRADMRMALVQAARDMARLHGACESPTS